MTQSTAPRRKGFRLFGYFGEIINELKKVVWLKWPQEVLYLTGMVLIVTIIAGVVLGALDFGFSELVSRVFMAG
ncbi:MAG: preprotein translocase subunit SecE [Chloroflexi bacterium RBG_13_48_17]|nr:MAG: preprotein translocase subunit SecE [Chloroflexi bacterium RBG_13_48_17]